MKKILKLLSLIVVFTLILSGCSQKAQNSEGSSSMEEGSSPEELEESTKDESVEVEATSKMEPLTLNLEGGDWGYPTPYAHYARGPGIYKMKLIFDSMMETGEEGLIPFLAEKWDIEDSGRSYTFYIRKGVQWHDGEALSAEDIKFSFDYYKEYPPVMDDLARSKKDYIEEINVIDKYTLNIKIKSPDATLLERFGTARIIPKHIWEKVEDPLKFQGPEAVIGSGPYKLADYSKEQGAYKFEAFRDYWGYKPAAATLRFIPVSDPILAFENADIDIVAITPDILSKYQEDPSYKIVESPAIWGYRILLNMEARPELKEKALRQAIAYGIDRDELIDKVARGAAKIASPGFLPIEHSFYNDNIKKYDFNLEKSRSLLDGKEYEFSLLTGNSNAEVRIAELIKLNFEKIGIKLRITSLDMKSRDAAIKSGEYELVLNGHGLWGTDPDNLRIFYNSEFQETPGYLNEEIDALSNEQLVCTDPQKRKEIIFELQEVIAEEIPMLTLYNTSGFTVYRPEKYDGWTHVFNHHEITHNKISYLIME